MELEGRGWVLSVILEDSWHMRQMYTPLNFLEQHLASDGPQAKFNLILYSP